MIHCIRPQWYSCKLLCHFVYSEGASAPGVLRSDQALDLSGGRCMPRSTRLQDECDLHFVGNRTFVLRGSGGFLSFRPMKPGIMGSYRLTWQPGKHGESTYISMHKVLTLNTNDKDFKNQMMLLEWIPFLQDLLTCISKLNGDFTLQTYTGLCVEHWNRNWDAVLGKMSRYTPSLKKLCWERHSDEPGVDIWIMGTRGLS